MNITVGPGVRHAIIWLSIITSFWAGWYVKGEIFSGEMATAGLVVLKDDIVEKQRARDMKAINEKALELNMEGKTYDKDCGNMSINEFYQ